MSEPITLSLPRILLSADSNIPPSGGGREDGTHSKIPEAIQRVLNCLNEEIPDYREINLAIEEAIKPLKKRCRNFADSATSAQQRTRLADVVHKLDSEEIGRADEFLVYDEYFGVTRSAIFTPVDLETHLTFTATRALEDIQHSVLGVDELSSVINSMKLMLEYCDGISASQRNAEGALLGPNAPLNSIALPPPVRSSEYRWRIGHHFFAFATQFCRHFLVAVARNDTSAPPDEIAGLIRKAHICLRGTTAAMWHAANMSRHSYQKTIRPSMVNKGGDGFSGTQHLDYERLKQAREAAIQWLEANFGSVPSRWPSAVRTEFRDYCEAEVEDLEHHTLIAASKVGRTTSLLQDATHPAKKGDQVPGVGLTAVDHLRSMAKQRRAKLSKFL
ncbi:hypothetical protein ACF1AO_37080 [Streptomyces longwoodensis]|uniref:hypothetical protein n=1 Tax=Streptomyces longwoodensis TaxID=68231 RepID=UPI0036FD9166